MFFCVKQKTAYDLRSSDWSSDVCSSDLATIPEQSSGLPPADRNRRPGRAKRGPVTPDAKGGGRNRAAVAPSGARRRQCDYSADASANLAETSLTKRSEERRVGERCVRTVRSRGTPYH